MKNRREFLKSLSMASAAMAFSGMMNGCSTSAKKTNIVFILIDDLGWADIGCYGNQINKTPNIDQLAKAGMRFTDAYAACPVCSPTRASIHSGQYPARVGVIDFIPGHWRPYEKLRVPTNRTQYLPLQIPTLAEMMKKAGYTTAHFGKWHLGGGEHTPEHQGFDVTTPPMPESMRKPRPKSVIEWIKATNVTENNPKDVDRLTQLAVDFVQDNKEKPFFLYLSHRTVHIPLEAKPGTVEKYKQDSGTTKDIHPVYSAMVEEMDKSVGEVLQKLKDTGLEDNTLVVFFSDNGGLIQDYLKVGPIVTTNKPLRGEKGTLYEGGIREPLIVRWPGVVEPGTVCKTPVTSVDFYPTFLDMVGLNQPDDHILDGLSIMPLLTQKSNDMNKRAIYWHYPVYHHSTPGSAIREGAWKLVEFFQDGHMELYNLEKDVSESKNLVDEMPGKARELHQKLQSWRESVNARSPEENPDFDPDKRMEWGTHPDRR